jgi:hypothetical protein
LFQLYFRDSSFVALREQICVAMLSVFPRRRAQLEHTGFDTRWKSGRAGEGCRADARLRAARRALSREAEDRLLYPD